MVEKSELESPKDVECNKDYILRNLKLVVDELEPKGFFKLESDSSFTRAQHSEKLSLDYPDRLLKYFGDAEIVEPDRISRPDGDTTFFTTAGVQHVEAILREDGKLKKKLFAVAQPVIRSQFMDRVKDGTSTSFIDVSVESVGATPDEFIDLCDRQIQLIVDQGADPKNLKFEVEDSSGRWGSKKFKNSFLTVYFDGLELGECVYIHDYPVVENEKIPIADVCFGLERLNWGLGDNEYYFSGFDKFYSREVDNNKTTSIIDCIRTAVLIAGEGIKPSHQDPGYRLRQLTKRFVSRNQGVNIDAIELVNTSYEFWLKWGFKPTLGEAETVEVIKSENERSYNVLVLSLLEINGGPRINLNVNLPTADFLKHVSYLPKSTKKMIYEIIEKMK